MRNGAPKEQKEYLITLGDAVIAVKTEQLSDTWEYLMQGGLYSVRGYFKQGGEAGNIPETFQAKVGSSGFLDNYSTAFRCKKD
jgi:hypothetical protein